MVERMSSFTRQHALIPHRIFFVERDDGASVFIAPFCGPAPVVLPLDAGIVTIASGRFRVAKVGYAAFLDSCRTASQQGCGKNDPSSFTGKDRDSRLRHRSARRSRPSGRLVIWIAQSHALDLAATPSQVADPSWRTLRPNWTGPH